MVFAPAASTRGATAAMTPPAIATSRMPSMPLRGSMTCPPAITRSYFGVGLPRARRGGERDDGARDKRRRMPVAARHASRPSHRRPPSDGEPRDSRGLPSRRTDPAAARGPRRPARRGRRHDRGRRCAACARRRRPCAQARGGRSAGRASRSRPAPSPRRASGTGRRPASTRLCSTVPSELLTTTRRRPCDCRRASASGTPGITLRHNTLARPSGRSTLSQIRDERVEPRRRQRRGRRAAARSTRPDTRETDPCPPARRPRTAGASRPGGRPPPRAGAPRCRYATPRAPSSAATHAKSIEISVLPTSRKTVSMSAYGMARTGWLMLADGTATEVRSAQCHRRHYAQGLQPALSTSAALQALRTSHVHRALVLWSAACDRSWGQSPSRLSSAPRGRRPRCRDGRSTISSALAATAVMAAAARWGRASSRDWLPDPMPSWRRSCATACRPRACRALPSPGRSCGSCSRS